MRKTLAKTWDYDSAVAELKPLVVSWQKKTLEIVRLLYRANQELSSQGFRSDLNEECKVSLPTSGQMSRGCEVSSTPNSDPRTWEAFCEEVGLEKRTANRWLALYDAKEDRLLTKDEAKERALQIRDALFEDVRRHRNAGEEDWEPEKWSQSLENQYQAWLVEKGYSRIQIDPHYYDKLVGPEEEDDGLYDFGIMSRSFIHDIGVRATKRMSGDNAVKFDTTARRYSARIPSGVNPHEVMRIPELGMAALELFPPETRRQIAIVAAEAFRDLALEEY